MSNPIGVKPARPTHTATAFYRIIRPEDRSGPADAATARIEAIERAFWAALAEALAGHPASGGARLHLKIEIERPARVDGQPTRTKDGARAESLESAAAPSFTHSDDVAGGRQQ